MVSSGTTTEAKFKEEVYLVNGESMCVSVENLSRPRLKYMCVCRKLVSSSRKILHFYANLADLYIQFTLVVFKR